MLDIPPEMLAVRDALAQALGQALPVLPGMVAIDTRLRDEGLRGADVRLYDRERKGTQGLQSGLTPGGGRTQRQYAPDPWRYVTTDVGMMGDDGDEYAVRFLCDRGAIASRLTRLSV
jgi:hypothetical protein